MTDTAPQRTQYDLVPGMTAYRLNAILKRAQFGVYAAAIAAVVWYVFAQSTRGGSADRIVTYLIVLVPVLTWITISILLVRRRDAAETAAGYTTRAGVLHQFDQVDPLTGVVIRRAGSAVLTKPGRPATGDATGLSAGAVLNGGSSGGVRFDGRSGKTGAMLIGIVVVVAVTLVVAIPLIAAPPDGADTGFVLAVLLLVLGLTAVLIAAVYGGIALRTRQKTTAVARRRPDAFVFLSRRTPELQDALEELMGKYPSLGQSVTVSVGPLGVELWRGSADEPRVVLPWSAIGHVHPGRLLVAINNREFPARTIHIFLADGARLDAPLPVYGRHGITVAGADRANQVLDAFRRYTMVA
ncbi:hypothetical protein ABCS02_15460 [Microbacterium sp. X-17]|uniref:hypothetical protein n=1 Tax=Microbacterium sp. X-17 TaxID=3144404 RepID=UPI0031F49449